MAHNTKLYTCIQLILSISSNGLDSTSASAVKLSAAVSSGCWSLIERSTKDFLRPHLCSRNAILAIKSNSYDSAPHHSNSRSWCDAPEDLDSETSLDQVSIDGTALTEPAFFLAQRSVISPFQHPQASGVPVSCSPSAIETIALFSRQTYMAAFS